MVVSHYLVSGLGLVGYIITALGVFLLAEGIFGQNGHEFLRRLLVAVGWAFLAAAALGTSNALEPKTKAVPEWLAIAFGFIVGFAAGFTVPRMTQKLSQRLREGHAASWWFLGGLFILLVALGLLELLVENEPATTVLLSFGFALTILLLIGPLYSRLEKLTGRQFQIIGVGCALVGGVLLVIPQVLDLLNIKVV